MCADLGLDKSMGIQMDGQTERQTDKWMDKRHKWTNKLTDGWTCVQIEGWTEEWTYRSMDRQMIGWTKATGQVHRLTD